MYYVKYFSYDILIVFIEKVLLDIDNYDLFLLIKKRYRFLIFFFNVFLLKMVK